MQVKHYVSSTFAHLVVAAKKEAVNVKRLSPRRYILVTSQSLTPLRKKKIETAVNHPSLSENDVYGVEDLNNWLSLYPAVKRNYPEIGVVRDISAVRDAIHCDQKVHSDFLFEEIKEKVNIYVQGDFFHSANEIVEKNRIVILTGQPGVGKTVVAESLVCDWAEKGYEPVIGTVQECLDLYSESPKKFFFCDDFLGTNFLKPEALSEINLLKRLINLVRMAQSQHVLAMTTREHILQQLLSSNHRLADKQKNIFDDRIILNISNSSVMYRAEILYNHAYFKLRSPILKQAIVKDKFYWKVIEHRNYNPRIIETVIKNASQQADDADIFRDSFLQTLEDPFFIWEDAYKHQLKHPAQSLLLLIFSLGESLSSFALEELQAPFEFMHNVRAQRYRFEKRPDDFKDAVAELDESFVEIKTDSWSEEKNLHFLNPSIKDFLFRMADTNLNVVCDLIESICIVEQVESLNQYIKKNTFQFFCSNNINFNVDYFCGNFMLIFDGNKNVKSATVYLEAIKMLDNLRIDVLLCKVMEKFQLHKWDCAKAADVSAVLEFYRSLCESDWPALQGQSETLEFCKSFLLDALENVDSMKILYEIAECFWQINGKAIPGDVLTALAKAYNDYSSYLSLDVEKEDCDTVLSWLADFGFFTGVDTYREECFVKEYMKESGHCYPEEYTDYKKSENEDVETKAQIDELFANLE